MTNALGKSTKYDYDSCNNLTKVTDALGGVISYTYDSLHNKLTESDARGNVIHFSYNSNGLLSSVTDALGNKTQYQFNKDNRLEKIIDAKGNITKITYDARGRVIGVTDALGNTITSQYDAVGNLISTKDALGNTVETIAYDALNNPNSITDALGNSTTNSYDNLGKLNGSVDALERTTSIAYDKVGRIVSVTDPMQGVSSQSYDVNGNIKTITDPNNNTTTFGYDVADRLISETTAIGSVKTYGYNSLNLLSQMVNARGQKATREYDDLGRLISLSDETSTVSYTYDANGNVLTVNDSNGTIIREFDALNRVTKYTDVKGNVLQYEYDSLGNLVTLTYPDGKKVNDTYDAVNHLISVTDWAGRVTKYDYDANGQVVKTTRPDGSVMTDAYDAKGQLLQLKDVDKDGNVINQYDFTYDKIGNVTGEQSNNETQPSTAENLTMTYDKNNRLATYNGVAVTYDADGNMTNGQLKGKMVDFAYDSRNRLISAGNTSYVYDAENHRISINPNNDLTSFVINPGEDLSQTLMKTDSHGNKTYYVYGLGLIGEEDSDGTYKTYHFDRRGSTTALTDITGKVIDRYEYAPYGELTNHTGSSDTPFLFNGRDGVMTDSNGLYYMRSRYYNPEIKRFINADVVQGSINEGQTLNRYAYVNGNPISYVDPFGLSRDGDKDKGDYTLAKLAIGFTIIGVLAVFTVATGGACLIVTTALIGSVLGGGLGVVVGGVSNYFQGKYIFDNFADNFLWGTVSGALSGGLSGTSLKYGLQIIANGVINATTYMAGQKVNGVPIKRSELFASASGGLITGAIGGPGMMAEGQVLEEALAGAENSLSKGISKIGKWKFNRKNIPKAIEKLTQKTAAITDAVKVKVLRNFSLINGLGTGVGDVGAEIFKKVFPAIGVN